MTISLTLSAMLFPGSSCILVGFELKVCLQSNPDLLDRVSIGDLNMVNPSGVYLQCPENRQANKFCVTVRCSALN